MRSPEDTLPANRFWQPSCSHSTYQHEAITLRSRQLLKMGTWLPETCWASCKGEIKDNTKVTSSWYLIHTELRCTVNHTSDFPFSHLVHASKTKYSHRLIPVQPHPGLEVGNYKSNRYSFKQEVSFINYNYAFCGMRSSTRGADNGFIFLIRLFFNNG
jgi:hypothetical protein